VVIANGHGAYDTGALVAEIELQFDYCRTVYTSCDVFDAYGHPDSRPHGGVGAQARTPCTPGMAAITGSAT
jgi:hypothetical protein